MKKYYEMAIERNNSYAMANLANFYKEQKDYKNYIKFYKMAIEKNNNKYTHNLLEIELSKIYCFQYSDDEDDECIQRIKNEDIDFIKKELLDLRKKGETYWFEMLKN